MERDQKIIEAAQELFARYGYGRTTMADIASTAGVARQTLYNVYPNKEQVLRAVVRVISQTNIAQVKQAWEDASALAEKLDIYCEMGPLIWYDTIVSAPDTAEVLDGLNSIAAAEMAVMIADWSSAFAALFDAAGADDPEGLADYYVTASKHAKTGALDRATVERRLRFLNESVLSMLG